MLTLRHQVCKKLHADMFGAHLLNMKKNIFLLHQHVDTQTPSVEKVARRHVRCAPPQHEKIFFCYTNMLTLRHQVCKKLHADMFGAHLLNMKKNIFLLHQHVDTQTPSVEKVARRHVRCAPPQHEKIFFCYTNMLTLRHQVCKKLHADMFGAHLLNMKKKYFFVTPTC